ncbi:MAG: GntR family transcriptional regulator [Lachnospiraceae bacterium]|nr:GntR family transcriptional regulator [Lachnospiraceae bacterium]
MILLDERDKRPIYEQIVEKLSDLIARGILTEGTPMPSVRSFAADLSINPNTVQRAYLELERRGCLYSVKGKGSFVADPGKVLSDRRDKIIGQVRSLAGDANTFGVEKEALITAVEEGYGEAERSSHD